MGNPKKYLVKKHAAIAFAILIPYGLRYDASFL